MTRPSVGGGLPAAAAVLMLAGCGAEPGTPPGVRVQAGPQDVEVAPTQYCLDGEGRRYGTTPPVLEVSPGTAVTLTVDDEVAERGWAVQVFDDALEEQIGAVDVPDGEAVFTAINTSDVVPPAFYLVVVEDAVAACEGFSGAWPVGFIRAGG
ncbi:DUF2771 domain-containing protein [Geodermatophilus sp. YIM 151500]|uniref:DUF2771 domain-containing protein n=1 Tax=Geodermatophilus sp. YIM 151500 TaxID=2984531 RepID=UPI0021E3DF50|nr:DUF2771 domain-containing protein [Geodermatophilus sp. YIM 151500]MCV2489651.1 DUF2771 domain-containing protein [Geodermatophilus sp. YIM 151500]